jgi:glutamyl-tRNAGlu reductase-like protein
MSPIGRALHDRFESVCRSELQRLRRKTASLTEAERAQVDALALEVTRSLAVKLDAAVDVPGRAAIASVVMQLFAGSPLTAEETK